MDMDIDIVNEGNIPDNCRINDKSTAAITVRSEYDQNKHEEEMPMIPALVLSGVIIFPYALTPLVLSDEKDIRIAEKAAAGERLIAFFPEMPKRGDASSASGSKLPPGPRAPVTDGIEFKVGVWKLDEKVVSATGVTARIVKTLKFPDGTLRVLVRGLSRVRTQSLLKKDGENYVKVTKLVTKVGGDLETVAMVRNAIKQFQEVISFSSNFPEELKIAVLNLTDSERITDLISDTLNFSYPEKLAMLTLENFQERLHLLTILLNREVEVLRLGSEIQTHVHNVMSKSQREYFLREQLRQIQNELGEGEQNPDIAAFTERMKKIQFPPAVEEVVKKELERLRAIPQAAAEYNIAYTYIDWLLSIPWNSFTEDRIDVREAARILDHDHYGLKDVKERILEFLAILQLRKERKAPIICFVGPPGVGKTSLGKSIASGMGRKFVRISLGGVRDEAEIRGHRRTYIGALPGRIIQGMKKAGTSNPVFMLDELDKLANDQRGDPASALLEVLDPQQNNTFNDHYLDVDYDLSSVMFIATANIEDTIPGPLRDRMEIIRLPGYTAFEKHEIAKQYLIPRQMKENGLKADDILFTRGAVDELISHYTLEAGVRGLERIIGKVCRRIARRIVEGTIAPGSGTLVTPEKIHELLGARRFLEEEIISERRIGVVTGMAWTSVGGVTLQVEATMMPGKGELRLTGSLGSVMKESAMAAFSYVRSRAKDLGIRPSVFSGHDFHIHVPDGATPKDGPSAGVTMITALVSLLTGKYVRPRLSMTGEITLRGRVTAIGGVREKVIAALRAGVCDVILPRENEKDLEEVPEEIRRRIRFHFAEKVDDVLKTALLTGKKEEKIQPPCPGTASDPNEIYRFELPPDEEDAPQTPPQEQPETPAPAPAGETENPAEQKKEDSAPHDEMIVKNSDVSITVSNGKTGAVLHEETALQPPCPAAAPSVRKCRTALIPAVFRRTRKSVRRHALRIGERRKKK